MKKSEKRRIGEARQAQNLKDSVESGLKAQRRSREIEAKRKAAIEKAAAKKKLAEQAEKVKEATAAMKNVGESSSKAAKAMQDFVAVCTVDEEVDYPLVLDMTDETYAG